MRKLSISNLESARLNPSKYGLAMKEGTLPSSFGGNRAKSLKWFDAVMVYHKTRDLSKAITKLEQSFSKRKPTRKNLKELENLILALDNYVSEHNKYGYIYFDKTIAINKILTPQLRLGGWIWLLNMKTSGGYSGYVVSKDIDDTNWILELRYPIIQEYMANSLYGCRLDEVEVGVIDYTTGRHYKTCFSDEDINNALEELNDIGSTISSILDV